jgi:UDP-N-acetylglucosamine diphosphorylase/glucosamine-1-phosphate N-acetyltransferase
MKTSHAVILAAGEGKRMHPLTFTRPKVMLPLVNQPILEHLIIEMREAGISEFTFIVGYREEVIRDYFGSGQQWGVKIDYCQQKDQLGTAHAVGLAENRVEGPFLLANGDVIISRSDISRLLSQECASLTVVELPSVGGLGVIEPQEGRVFKIHEKSENPPTHLANAGLYLFTQRIFSAIRATSPSSRGEYELTDSLQNLIDGGSEVGYVKIDAWLDLSYPWDLLTANEKMMEGLKGQISGQIEANAQIKGEVRVGRNSLVRSGAYIVGPVIIGENCDIGPNCFIRPSTAIGNNCHVGAAVEIKNSIVMSGSKIPHLSYVGDSVIGENCNLGAGTKVANLRLDKKNISVAGIDTKRRKLGVIMGDGVQTGINANINVGTLIGNNCFIGPGVLAHGEIPPGSRRFQ